MASTMVHIRLDEGLKREACAALDSMGLTLSDAVRLLLVRVAAEKALPFDVRVPNITTVRAMEAARDDALQSFDSVGAMLDELNAKN